MEKLIELLNKHRAELCNWNTTNMIRFKYNGYIFNAWWLSQEHTELLIISKEYGFIKRLVENDKIDIFKSWIDELPRTFGYDYESVECKSDRLVMMLSIQNEPINFLISILK